LPSDLSVAAIVFLWIVICSAVLKNWCFCA